MTVGQGRAGECMLQVHLAQKAPRRVAFATMAGALNEIAAAVPLFALRWIGAKAGIVEIKELPQTHGAADGAGKWEGVRRRVALDRRHGAQERREIGDIIRGHALIGGVWEGRVEVLAVRGN